MNRRLLSALLLSGLLVAGGAGAVESTPFVLGSDGTSYRVWTGTFGEIFGANPTLPAATPILALDIVPPGQSFLRYLVPGTEGIDTESSAVLLYDASSNAVHLVWNTRTVSNQATSRLALRTLSAAGWSELTEVSGGTISDKTHLRVALVNDTYSTQIDGAEVRIPRRILHLVWSETIAGTTRSHYTPVVFVAGRYLGWNPVVALDDLASGETAGDVAAPVDLLAAPSIVASSGGKATAAFIHSATHRLVTAEIEALPGELGELSEMARGHIVELVGTGAAPDRNALAEMARGHIVELATRFHSSAANYLGAGTKSLLLEAPAEADAATLAEMARGHIVELGREILGNGLANHCAADGFELEIPPLVPAPGNAFGHLLALRRVASWALPAGTVAGQRLLTSTGGDRALLAWEAPGQLLYRETVAGGGWSELRSLDLTQMTAAEAWSAVASRVTGN